MRCFCGFLWFSLRRLRVFCCRALGSWLWWASTHRRRREKLRDCCFECACAQLRDQWPWPRTCYLYHAHTFTYVRLIVLALVRRSVIGGKGWSPMPSDLPQVFQARPRTLFRITKRVRTLLQRDLSDFHLASYPKP